MFYIQYWKPKTAEDENHWPFVLANSNQKIFKRIRKGDTLWVITGYPDYKSLVLFGKMFVKYSIEGKKKCYDILENNYYTFDCLSDNKYDLDIFNKDYYLLAELETIHNLNLEQSISINDIAKELIFENEQGSLSCFKYNGNIIDPQSLRAIRKLSHDSNNYLETKWKEKKHFYINL